MTNYRLFSLNNSKSRFVKAKLDHQGAVREIILAVVSTSKSGTPFTSERIVSPRAPEYAALRRSVINHLGT